MINVQYILGLMAGFIKKLIAFWRNIIEWIKKAVDKIKEILGIMVQGTRTFVLRTREGIKNRSKYYHENKINGELEEHVYTRNVDESEIPADILAKVRNSPINEEISTTEELKLAINV